MAKAEQIQEKHLKQKPMHLLWGNIKGRKGESQDDTSPTC